VTETAPAGWYPDPENPTQERYWDGATWTQNVAPVSPCANTPQVPTSPGNTPQPVIDAPVLQTWKSSVGFSVLGGLFGTPLLFLASPIAFLYIRLFPMWTGPPNPKAFVLILGLVGNLLMLVYAAKFYPSYFTEKPRLGSSKLISFANFMFGGLVFGLLWNGNLTKKTKGSSYLVSAVLSGMACFSFAFGFLAGLMIFALRALAS
jgi:hypothetical protein